MDMDILLGRKDSEHANIFRQKKNQHIKSEWSKSEEITYEQQYILVPGYLKMVGLLTQLGTAGVSETFFFEKSI